MERWRSPVKRARPESESPQGRGGSNPPRSVRADVAQLAEPLICNQQVAGSMPAVGLRGCSSAGERRLRMADVAGSIPASSMVARGAIAY